MAEGKFSALVIGNESLVVQCCEALLGAGHLVSAVVTRNDDIRDWAIGKMIPVLSADADLVEACGAVSFDWLLSIANLDMLPEALLAQAKSGAVNFHDGPLPRYAGLNAPVWALLGAEQQHGITWHLMTGTADTGDILAQRMFDISSSDTALTLNTKCFAAAIDSFSEVISGLENGGVERQAQDLSLRSYYGRDARPASAGRLDFTQTTAEVLRLVRALDHGTYWNPLCCPKIEIEGQIVCVGAAETVASDGLATPGTVIACEAAQVDVATLDGVIRLQGLRGFGAEAVPVAKAGTVLAGVVADPTAALDRAMRHAARSDGFWRARLKGFSAARMPLLAADEAGAKFETLDVSLPAGMTDAQCLAAVAAWALGGGVEVGSDIAVVVANDVAAAPYLSDWVPVTLSDGTVTDVAETLHGQVTDGVRRGGFAVDIALRDQTLPAIDAPDIAILRAAQDGPITGCAYNLRVPADGGVMALLYDASRIDSAHAARMIARLEMAAQAVIAQPEGAISALPMLSEDERAQVLTGWNETALATDAACVHHAIEAQVLRSPDATAVVFEGQSLSYSALNVAANRVAHRLIAMGIGPGKLVGLHCARSLDLMIAALGILKAGGAYVPLDPAYPLDRLAHYIADSAAPVIITQSALAGSLPEHAAQLLVIDADPLNDQPEENPESNVSTDDLAYVIYTSGSTGTPKGVMVEHGNVANFFDGMDARVPHDMGAGQQVWLAVTSLSFDISVLELFYTLARGFKVVVGGDKQQMQVSNGSVATQGGMEFSIYYWGNDDAPGPKKYELLLEGAKFADQNGFVAVWTPERHFHAFGGPYPNPSVTGAAAAAVTKNIGVRAGSCVAPLHHTARIAEEWAVIDNLTNGRAGLAIASGWQPDDFVLRPENTPPENRTAMFEQIRDLRKLWRGEAVDFPRADGTMFSAVTQPRPVSDAPEIWVTTAGNPETWKEAGKAGAHILTHLLGQSISEVQQKIGLYHDALREAGYDPAEFKITLMLHTFVGADREEVRETAREPMKNYLRSAAGLIKQYAWAFPAFKKPEGVSNPFQLDLGSLSEDELEGILDFAFLRYFEDSGLFGTVEDCVTRVEELKLAGVSEVACLIDYGIATDVVLEGLKPLAEVLRRTNVEGGPHDRDFSLAAQMVRHGVTHLQCTPSMARMLVTDDVARGALRGVEHLFIGGEALPGTLVRELSGATTASIENMYGPTETTIWSTTGAVDEAADAIADTANIGSPITNTQVYVLSEEMQPVPVGVAGELYIGGKGVTRGYLQRDTLTAERFVDNPFDAGRMYRTGDLVRWRQDGKLDFLGRIDHQVKLRGYRIELGEIEAKLEALDSIGQAVVIAREDQPGDIRLVGYVTADGVIDQADLRRSLQVVLPEFMVPVHYVQVPEFPLTPNKKIDRKALPAPRRGGAVAAPVEPVAAVSGPVVAGQKTETGRQISEIWARILGLNSVSLRDNFFDLGGHSLLAIQAHREIRDTLKLEKISITDIFRFPVLSDLAARLDAQNVVATVAETEAPVAANDRATARGDAMSKRRAMRAKRRTAAQ